MCTYRLEVHSSQPFVFFFFILFRYWCIKIYLVAQPKDRYVQYTITTSSTTLDDNMYGNNPEWLALFFLFQNSSFFSFQLTHCQFRRLANTQSTSITFKFDINDNKKKVNRFFYLKFKEFKRLEDHDKS